MSPQVTRLFTAAVLAATIFVPSAEAFHKGVKHKSFFESLGGKSSGNAATRQTAKKKERAGWVLEDGQYVFKKGAKVAKSDKDSDVKVFRLFGSGKRKTQTAVLAPTRKDKRAGTAATRAVSTKANKTAISRAVFVEPEPLPGFGMGNVPYVMPKLQQLRDPKVALAYASSTEANAIKLVLTDEETTIRSSQAIREAVVAHYSSKGFAPIWIKDGKPSERAEAVLAVLAASDNDALIPARYLPQGMTSFVDPQSQFKDSSLAAAQFDVALTVAVLTYATHMTGGSYDPDKLSLYHDIKTEAVDPATALRVLAFSPFPKDYLASLEPKHPAYAILKKEMGKLRTELSSSEPFPSGKTVKLGQKDERVPELRGRMIRLGYLTAELDVDGPDPLILDEKLSSALKVFQKDVGIAAKGQLDSATVAAFGEGAIENRVERLAINMERIRWLPKNLGQKHVFANQASYEVDFVVDGKVTWESHIIVGKPMTQTYSFHDQMENVVINPPWGMPQSILVNEYMGKLRRDPGYFDRIGYKVTSPSGKVVSSRSVNWNSLNKGGGYGVQQPPGPGNALGELKFNFPNSHAIYMHDTPNRNLFEESRRNFSHGCVRVQNPREFAALLLGMTEEQIAQRIEDGESVTVPLDQKIPVHLTYFTAWPDAEGKIRYYSDVYERDEALTRANDIVTKAFTPGSVIKVVEASTKEKSKKTLD